MTEQTNEMPSGEAKALMNRVLSDPKADLAVPLALSLLMREGLHSRVLATLSRGDYHPAVEGVPGSLTYRDGDQMRAATLSSESELLLSAYLEWSAWE
ncbi:hypothetical protein [Streptomyces sp. NPDC048442]|uniref:hypothetical protein n=1 Tax=Streptomyces sp. NPDC048442 TaxID=3154823 RepID=UPI0034229695